MLSWLWYRPAAAGLIQPLALELPNATGAARKRKEKEKKETVKVLSKVSAPFCLPTSSA